MVRLSHLFSCLFEVERIKRHEVFVEKIGENLSPYDYWQLFKELNVLGLRNSSILAFEPSVLKVFLHTFPNLRVDWYIIVEFLEYSHKQT
jgi:hypothetical protein